MKPETQIHPDPAFRFAPVGADLSDMRIECVSFDRHGLPRRRRLVSVLSMLGPKRGVRLAGRRAAILSTFRD